MKQLADIMHVGTDAQLTLSPKKSYVHYLEKLSLEI